MLNYFLYPGQGQKLRSVSGANGNVISPTNNDVIPAGGYTEGIAGHDCIELMFSLQTDANSSVSADIETSNTPDFANSSVAETVAFPGGRVYNWSGGQFLTGFCRVHNNTAANMTVFCQKRIAG